MTQDELPTSIEALQKLVLQTFAVKETLHREILIAKQQTI